MFYALSDLVQRVHWLTNKGWKFQFIEEERKFETSRMIATKGDKEEVTYHDIEGLLLCLCEMEIQEEIQKSMRDYDSSANE